jgi:hypothetical protein
MVLPEGPQETIIPSVRNASAYWSPQTWPLLGRHIGRPCTGATLEELATFTFFVEADAAEKPTATRARTAARTRRVFMGEIS